MATLKFRRGGVFSAPQEAEPFLDTGSQNLLIGVSGSTYIQLAKVNDEFSGNLLLDGNISSSGYISASYLQVENDIALKGNIRLGDSGSIDTIFVSASFSGSLIPDTDNNFSLGSSTNRWATAHIVSSSLENVQTSGSLVVDGDLTVTQTSSLNYIAEYNQTAQSFSSSIEERFGYIEGEFSESIETDLTELFSTASNHETRVDLLENAMSASLRLYVSPSGSDDNDGTQPYKPFRTLKAAVASIGSGSASDILVPNQANPVNYTIFVGSGNYSEINPITVPPGVAIVGDSLRTVRLYPQNPTKDFFHVHSSDYFYGLRFIDLQYPAFAFSFPASQAIATITSGSITSVNLVHSYEGYDDGTLTDIIVESPNSGSINDTAQISATVSGGVITGFTIIDSGSNYGENEKPHISIPSPEFYQPVITTSPYVQNCSAISGPFDISGQKVLQQLPYDVTDITGSGIAVDEEGAGGGIRVDGNLVSGSSPLESFVADAFTQVNQGGPGHLVTNNGYAQFVSCFTTFCTYGFKMDNGGFANISNSVIDFGKEGLVSKRYFPTPFNSATGSEDKFSSVSGFTITQDGAGYTGSQAGVTLGAPDIPGGVQATATANVTLQGTIDQIVITNAGTGYTTEPSVIIDAPTGPGGLQATATSVISGVTDMLVEVNNPTQSIEISSNMILNGENYLVTSVDTSTSGSEYRVINTFPKPPQISDGDAINFHKLSNASTGQLVLEYAGSGVTYNSLPKFGGQPDNTKEIIEFEPGRVFFATTDNIGNLKVGDFFQVNQLTGEVSIDANNFNLVGIDQIGPFRRNEIPVGVTLKEVSNNTNLLNSQGVVGQDTTPTQFAVYGYVNNYTASTDERVDNLELTGSDHETRVVNLESTGSDHENRVVDLETTGSDHETRVVNLESTGSDHEVRVTDLETTGSDHEERVVNLESTGSDHEIRVVDLENTGSDHEQRVVNLENTGSDHEVRIVDLESTGSDHEVRVVDLETTGSDQEGRLSDVETTSSIQEQRIDSIESNTGSYARTDTTNTFSELQTFDNISVLGTGSFGRIESVTGSAKIIGDAFIILNNNTPGEPYAGISVIDSGSSNSTSSFFYDGNTDDWKYEYSSSTSHVGAIALFGPEGEDVETFPYPKNNYILKGLGGHHVSSSRITDDGIQVEIETSLNVIGAVSASSFTGNANTLNFGGTTLLSSSQNFTTYTSSIDNKFSTIETVTESFGGRLDTIEVFTSSQELKNTTLENTTSSYESRFSTIETTTASFDTKLDTIDLFTSSQEVKNTTLESVTSSFDSRLDSLEIDSGSQNNRITSLETTTQSLDGRLDTIEQTTQSFDGRLDNIENTTESFESRIQSLETESSSIDNRVDDLEVFSASLDTIYLQVNGDNVVSGADQLTSSLDSRYATEARLTDVSSSYATLVGEFNVTESLGDAAFYFVSSSISDGNPEVLGNAGAVKDYIDAAIIANAAGDVTEVLAGDGLGGGGFSGSITLNLNTGSTHFITAVDDIISGSVTQTTWDNIAGKPSGLVSSSDQVLVETNGGNIDIITEDGDIRLQTIGTGIIELDSSVELKGGEKIRSADNTQIIFEDTVNIESDLIVSGTVDGVDVSTLDSNFQSLVSSSLVSSSAQITDSSGILSSSVGDFLTYSSSVDTRIDSLEIFSSSIDNEFTTETELNTATASLSASINEFYLPIQGYGVISGSSQLTSSYDTRYVQLSYTGSTDSRLNEIELVTQSHDTRLSNLESFSSSIDDDFVTETELNNTTSSLSSSISEFYLPINGFGIVSGSSQLSSSYDIRYTPLSYTGSTDGRLNLIEQITQSHDSRLNNLEGETGSYAVTNGDNVFGGNQTFNNITVDGTASFAVIESITGSAKIIGDAYIILNNNTPTERYAGLKVQDSGSVNTTSSFEYDGQTNDWFYQYTDDGGVNDEFGIALFGPEYNTKGAPTYLTSGSIPKGDGGHHLYDSNITDNGLEVGISTSLNVVNSITASSFLGDIHATNGIVSASSQVDHDSTTNFVANEHIDHSQVEVIAGNGLTGGGTITQDRTLTIGEGSGINVLANSIEVSVPDFLTNGADNRLVTATGTDGFNAESNLTFDGNTLEIVGDVSASSYQGDGSQLTGISPFPFTGSAEISGSVIVTGSIDSTDTITANAFVETSYRDIKDNIVSIGSQLENIQKLNPVSYTFKGDDKQQYGFIVDEMIDTYPQFISSNEQGIQYSKLTSVLVKAVQELSNELQEHKKIIEELRQKLS